MTAPPVERQLAREIRAELAAIAPHRACCRRAEAAAFGRFPSRAAGARQAPLARAARRLGHPPGEDGGTWDWDASADHCRLAYLRGLFLTRGSLSVAEGRAHLEFVLEPDEAREVSRWVAELGLPAGQRVRRGRGVVTWKSAETIATFLRLAGAGNALNDLEARRVARALRGDLNRALNAEAANLGRTVGSGLRQVGAIDALAADGRLGALPPETRRVARARREAPSATLAELSEATGLHRSHVQRELERIERIAARAASDAAGMASDRPRSGVAGSI